MIADKSNPAAEAHYRRWWDIHKEFKPFQAKLPMGAAGQWPLKVSVDGKVRDENVAGFCHVEFVSEQIEWWGFEKRAERDRFVGLYGGEAVG